MAEKWVSSKPMSNARVEELQGKFAQAFPRSFLTGALIGGDYGLSGDMVCWVIVQAWEPSSSITLKLSKDSTTWIVESKEGDVSKVTAMLAQEGLTLKR